MIKSKTLIISGIVLFGLAICNGAQFSDDFESGLSKWGVTSWTGATFVEDINGNGGKGGHYQIGTNNGWIQVASDAWKLAGLDNSNYKFEADLKFISNDMSCLVAGRANDLWKMDSYGVAFYHAAQNDWVITIYGPLATGGPIFTPSTAPEGLVFHTDGTSWNHVELTLQGTWMEVTINGTLLYAGNGHSSRSLTGPAVVRTGWLGNFVIDNVIVEDMPFPISCEGVQRSGYGIPGDINGDCYVNIGDFASIGQDWLVCNMPEDPNNCSANWR